MATKVQVIFYSMYGHVHQMAEAVAAGSSEITGVEVELFQVPELCPPTTREKRRESSAGSLCRYPDGVRCAPPEADAIIFGTPTRFGNMCAQMRNFLDQCGGLWARGQLENKIGSVFASTGTQHGGQETTITSFFTTLFHLGMIVVGTPYWRAGYATWRKLQAVHPTARQHSPAPTAAAAKSVRMNLRSLVSKAAMLLILPSASRASAKSDPIL